MTLKTLGQLLHLIARRHPQHQSQGAENLFPKGVVLQVGLGVGFKEVRLGTAAFAVSAHQRAHGVAAGETFLAIAVGFGDAVGQHNLRADLFQRFFCGGDKGIALRALGHDRDAGVGAELPRPHGQRPGPSCANFRAAVSGGLGQNEHRVDRAQLAEKRDRLGALRAEIE